MRKWGWRTKPRSVIKTVQWFKEFASLEGKNWNYISEKNSSNGYPIHPIRREYYFNTQIGQDESSPIFNRTFSDYLSGRNDEEKDSESNARNDAATYKFFGFGYVDRKGIVRITKAGQLIVNNRFDGEFFLKQLLKLNFPSLSTDYGRKIPKRKRVYPLQIIIKLLFDLGYVSNYELAYIFYCCDISEYKKLLKAIEEFRIEYAKLENKNSVIECQKIFKKIAKKYFSISKNENIETLFTMCDAINRTLIYTNLFNVSGRGDCKKITIAEHSRKKVELLQEKYIFHTIPTSNLDEYMEWYGDVDNIILPWEKKKSRKELINNKIELLNRKIHTISKEYAFEVKEDIEDLYAKLQILSKPTELKEFEDTLINKITSLNEKVFIQYTSKTKEVKDEIVHKFQDIVKDKSKDMAALWLECNTWKSLIAMNGEKTVQRNFKIEENLTPQSFAPGKNETADIELFTGKNILIFEVSLMSGVQQWEHEGSSVVSHTLNQIQKFKKKPVYTVFISKKINQRTSWQFFILNKNSWLEIPIPVIPLTIAQYNSIIKFMYKENIDISYFVELIKTIHEEAKKSPNYKIWNEKIDEIINCWKKVKKVETV